MLIRHDPFQELDRLAEQFLGGTRRMSGLPLDAYRDDDHFVVDIDMPGVDPSSIDLTVEKDVLTVAAERPWQEDRDMLVAERPHGQFRRQLFLGESLDVDRIDARYEAGVLRVTIPIAEQARARKVEVRSGGRTEAIEASGTDALSSGDSGGSASGDGAERTDHELAGSAS